MKVPNKIPTRLYGRAAVSNRAGGTIWGGAFSSRRGFPVSFPSSVQTETELIKEMPMPAETIPEAGVQAIVDPISAFSPVVSVPVTQPVMEPLFESVIQPITEPVIDPVIQSVTEPVIEPVTDAAIGPAAGNTDAPLLDISDKTVVESTDIQAAESIKEARETVAPPPLVPATPAPFQPDHVHGYKTEVNEDGTRDVKINGSRITIPDLDILAAIPD
ncbi:hypothetical protein SAMN05421663_10258 [Terribacillus halophilus]|uniref:Uncharacterized protein n=1 Tax=Terribacillus halophilus TaxID=361279 RepID=A0A1G6KLN2_9BACI|nr:hypothetical protein SAMN05421663_10258 [Terribacillus halophilus]